MERPEAVVAFRDLVEIGPSPSAPGSGTAARRMECILSPRSPRRPAALAGRRRDRVRLSRFSLRFFLWIDRSLDSRRAAKRRLQRRRAGAGSAIPRWKNVRGGPIDRPGDDRTRIDARSGARLATSGEGPVAGGAWVDGDGEPDGDVDGERDDDGSDGSPRPR